ncbi:hypothetical protein COL99_24355 [Bacillus toyonensis]|uniref:hypothetical protein n=2 Tax=Bacillus toyonensis TaxID=155322 RepID=UPI000BF8B54C|nr:hypothetical protein [Bacillus toyonensis]PGC09927.1 hypothetical protein COL99_24355 [Bacillus toyonensis]PGC78825.1 hypothetical protein COM28_19415 [Bacillus toyonensis]
MRVRGYVHILTRMQLDSIRSYADEMEKANKFKLEELSREAEEDTKDLTEEEQDKYWDWKVDEINEVKKTFPSLLRYSTVVSVYSIIEQALLRIVKPHMAELLKYEDVGKLNPKFNDELRKFKYKGSLIEKLRQYIHENIDLEFPCSCEEWNFITDLNIIRNNIVHCNGRIYDDQDSERLEKVIASYNSITFSESNEIVLQQEFVQHMIKSVEDFFLLLFNPIPQNT